MMNTIFNAGPATLILAAGSCCLLTTNASAYSSAMLDQPESASKVSNQSTGEADKEMPEDNNSWKPTFTAEISGSLLGEADFDTDIGTIEYSTLSAKIGMDSRVGDSGILNIGFEAMFTDYDINPSASAVAGDAATIGSGFDDVTTLSLSAIYANRINAESSWFIGGGVIVSGEDDADFDDSIDGFFTTGYRHTVNDKLELGIGVLVRTRLDDDVLIVPIPQIKYTIDEHWSIATQRAGLRLNYKASDSLNYGISGEYSSMSFRLDDSHASAADGMATHRRIPVAFYTEYEVNNTIEINAQIGAQLAGELEILNTSGNEITSQDIDAGIFGSLNVSFKF